MATRTVITVHAEDWARTRFVQSLLWETVQAVRTLAHPGKQLHHRAWLNTVDHAAARARLRILLGLNPPAGWVPDFLAPAPRTGAQSIDEELAQVATYATEAVARDIQRSLQTHHTRRREAELGPLIDDPATGLTLILDELSWAWTTLVAPYWPQLSGLIATDVAHRSREITRLGLGRVISDLHPDVTWRDTAIVVAPGEAIAIDLDGKGLALMPSAFSWPSVIVAYEPPWSPTLIYPARGVGELWTAPPRAPTGLTGVLGPTRARLLVDLASPTSTTALAARHHLSPAAVSTQLTKLYEAALVSRRRTGKEVQYQRTATADALIAAAAPHHLRGP